ncbi:MAG TPA: TetR/AcrR family transcriptional regulator [Acidimicrobiia bacterium]
MADRLTREEKKAQTRARLMEAAAAVFARRGLAAASLDEIAEEAGLTKGAIYSNFASKEDLVLAVLDEAGRERIHDITADVDASRTVDEEARRAGAQFMASTQEELPLLLLALELTAYSGRNPEFRDRQIDRHRESLREIADVMEASAPDFGIELPLPPRQMAIVLNALGIGLSIEKLLDPEGVPDDLFATAIMLMYGIRGREPDRQPSSGTAPS